MTTTTKFQSIPASTVKRIKKQLSGQGLTLLDAVQTEQNKYALLCKSDINHYTAFYNGTVKFIKPHESFAKANYQHSINTKQMYFLPEEKVYGIVDKACR